MPRPSSHSGRLPPPRADPGDEALADSCTSRVLPMPGSPRQHDDLPAAGYRRAQRGVQRAELDLTADERGAAAEAGAPLRRGRARRVQVARDQRRDIR